MNRRVGRSEPFGAELGETSSSKVPITTDSGEVFRAEVYTTVNVTRDPELRDELVDGTLNVVEGPDGQNTYEPAVAVRYHDEENRVFALVVPNELRHRAFELRSELLEELAEVEASMPDYVANFATVFDPTRLEDLERVGTDRDFEGNDRSRTDEKQAEENDGRASAVSESEVAEKLDEIEREWEEIEEARDDLDRRRKQLDEVRERIDRERTRMDELEQELTEERAELEQLREELEAERRDLEAEKLKLEEETRRAERDDGESVDEVTQVVTDDQFVEVTDESEAANAAAPGEGTHDEETAITESPPSAAANGELAAELGVVVEPTEQVDVPEEFDEQAAGSLEGYVEFVEGRVLAACRLPGECGEALCEEPPKFYVQHHVVDDVPLVALTLAALDADQAVEESFGWPLNLADESDIEVVDALCKEMELNVAIYGEEGVRRVYRISGPLEENLQRIRHEVETEIEALDDAEFEAAAEPFQSEAYERVGEMRHNFERQAFHELETASQVKLAAGVVGFWSSDDQLEYLVANRSYPLLLFRALQEDVVAAAVETGIHLDAPLREIAVEMELVDDEAELVERQLANFAEVAVQLRENDLDPVDEWENWEALIDLARELGLSPDPDVIELAEASLKRAQDYQQTRQPRDPAGEAAADGGGAVEAAGAVEVDEDLVVSRRSEATGVTYFLPDEAVIDSFDDLADVPREDLEKLLEDPNGRLEAAQMLVERYGSEVVPTVLETAERMAAPEVTALARFFETQAEGLESELVSAVESSGPSATYIAARALADIESTSGLPTLLEAYRDSGRQINRPAIAETLAAYGDQLISAVTRSVREDGIDEEVVTLLAHVDEQVDEALLETLIDEHDDEVREAAERARNRRL